MFLISLLKLGFTLKEIDLSLFSSLQRYFLHLPNFLLSSKASAPVKRTQQNPIRKRKLIHRSIKKKSKAKLIITTYIAFSKQYFGWPYLQPSSINLTTCGIVALGFCCSVMIRVRWIAISFVMRQRCLPHIGMFSFLDRE